MSVTLSLSSATSGPGGVVTLTLSIASTGGDQPAQVQWVFAPDADSTLVGVTIGAAATAATKTLSRAGNLCLIWGINQTVIADGVLATAQFRLGPLSSGTSTINVSGIVVSDANANPLTGIGVPGIITIIPAPPMPGMPCSSVTPQETDVQFKLEKVMACMRTDAHLPTRGSVR